jgi:hypothetical protein
MKGTITGTPRLAQYGWANAGRSPAAAVLAQNDPPGSAPLVRDRKKLEEFYCEIQTHSCIEANFNKNSNRIIWSKFQFRVDIIIGNGTTLSPSFDRPCNFDGFVAAMFDALGNSSAKFLPSQSRFWTREIVAS